MTAPTIAVVDHGAGNLVSIAQALQLHGASVVVAERPSELASADAVVLPGVGAMAAVMGGIEAGGFVDALTHLDVPLFGICVGMQVLFERSEEDDAVGLGLIPGTVRRIASAPRLPHIGWNELALRPDPMFEGVPDGSTVYFVHSYAPHPFDPDTVVATTTHGSTVVAAVRSGHVSGTQFHPERSGTIGLRILGNVIGAAATVKV